MRKFRWLYVWSGFFMLLCGYLPTVTYAQIIINEINAHPTTPAQEWIEIYNTSSSTIDLTNWIFFENNVRHGLKPVASAFLSPGAYAIIAENAATFATTYPMLTTPIFDSSWSSGLSGLGELIALRNEDDETVEQFIYPPSSRGSLERVSSAADPNLAASWIERQSGDSAGMPNSAINTPASPPTPPAPSPAATSTILSSVSWNGLTINEAMVAPTTGTEWVELYNNSSTTIDLSGGILCDNRTSTSCTVASLAGTLAARAFVVVHIDGSKLNNSGDSIILKQPDGTTIDSITYGITLLPASDQVVARTVDGGGIWAISTMSTKGVANIITAPATPVPVSTAQTTPRTDDTDEPTTPAQTLIAAHGSQGIVWYATSSPIALTELFPNPDGDDRRSEFIEITNTSDTELDLTGWKLWVDSAIFPLSGIVPDGDSVVWNRSVSRLELRNTTSSLVRLLDPDLMIRDEIYYPLPVPRGESYTRISNRVWQWRKPTPKTTTFHTISPTKLAIDIPTALTAGEPYTLTLKNTPDPRGGEWFGVWQFNKTTYSGQHITFMTTTTGEYTLTINATSTMGSVGHATYNLQITDDGSVGDGRVIISEVYSNADAPEELPEFIELWNNDTRPVRLDGWRLQTKSGASYTIPESTHLAPDAFAVFYSLANGLTLNDKGEDIKLYNATGARKDRVIVPSLRDGFSHERTPTRWTTSPTPTPHRRASTESLSTEPSPTHSITTTAVRSAQKSAKTKKTASVTSTNKDKKTPLSTVRDLSVIATLRKGTRVVAEGIVVAPPGVFGSQYAAIADEHGGTFIYQQQKKFPSLDYGDTVRIQGTISENAGRKRINVSGENAFDILATNETLEPSEISSAEATTGNAGKIVSLKGELTAKKTTNGFLDDDTGEIAFSLKSGTGLTTKQWNIGTRLTMTGVLVSTTKGFEIWPRTADDIVWHTTSPDTTTSLSSIATIQRNQQSNNHLYAVGVAGSFLVGGGLAWRWYRAKKLPL